MHRLVGLGRGFLAICAVLAAASVTAADAADPVVHVDTDNRTNAAHVRASITIAAPPAAVWSVITDCARAPRIFPNMESCRIVQHDAGGRWDVREHIIAWISLMPRLHTLVRMDYEAGRRMLFKRVGGDMRISEGEWRLEPIDNARATRLYYNALVAPNFPVPDFLVEQAVHDDLPNMLRAIGQAAESDAGRR